MVLPVPGVAGEHEVAALVGHRQVALAAQVLHPDQVGDQLHLGLHAGEADQVVELGHQLLEGAGRRELGLGRLDRRRRPAVAVLGDPGLRLVSGRARPARRSVARNRSIARELGLGRVRVDGGHREGDGHRAVVVGPRVGGALAAVVAGQEVEHDRGLVEPGGAGRRPARPAQVVGSGPQEVAAEPRPEQQDERPQLGVGVDAVAVDEGGREVEGLVHHVAGELADVDPLDLPGQGR